MDNSIDNSRVATRISLQFQGFWPGFDEKSFWMTRLLEESFTVARKEPADLIIFSDGVQSIPSTSTIKIYYTFENLVPNFQHCDWAFTFLYTDCFPDPRNMRHFGPIQSKEASDSLLLKNKTHRYNFEREKFCNFIFSHETPFRNWFFSQLSKYKKIDAPGRAMNNCPPIEPIPEGAVRNAHIFSQAVGSKIKLPTNRTISSPSPLRTPQILVTRQKKSIMQWKQVASRSIGATLLFIMNSMKKAL